MDAGCAGDRHGYRAAGVAEVNKTDLAIVLAIGGLVVIVIVGRVALATGWLLSSPR